MGHEQEEFAEFYRASRDSCLKAVTAVVGDRQLAEDLVAEAFARAWTSWGKVRRHAAPRGWVVRTALNTGVSWWRRRREVPLADFDGAAPADTSGGVDPALIAALRRLRLASARSSRCGSSSIWIPRSPRRSSGSRRGR